MAYAWFPLCLSSVAHISCETDFNGNIVLRMQLSVRYLSITFAYFAIKINSPFLQFPTIHAPRSSINIYVAFKLWLVLTVCLQLHLSWDTKPYSAWTTDAITAAIITNLLINLSFLSYKWTYTCRRTGFPTHINKVPLAGYKECKIAKALH